MMWEQGFLDSRQMAGAFQMLRSNDLIWSRLVHDYLLGEREPMTDLMAWNADATRMPYRMHSEYLRKLFLDNDLAAPWRSTYKIFLQVESDVTYLLTAGGHNAGIVSEPGHQGRIFRVATKRLSDHYVDPDSYYANTPVKQGSWWPDWVAWLKDRCGPPTGVPAMGAPQSGYPPLSDAPGLYVLEH
jgi:polyhydroxyalkanoate synthase